MAVFSPPLFPPPIGAPCLIGGVTERTDVAPPGDRRGGTIISEELDLSPFFGLPVLRPRGCRSWLFSHVVIKLTAVSLPDRTKEWSLEFANYGAGHTNAVPPVDPVTGQVDCANPP